MKKGLMVFVLAIIMNVVVPAPKVEAQIVYDPTNYSANIQTSLKQVESVVNEIKMLENQTKNLAALGQVAELSQLKSSLSKLMALKSQVTGLLGSYSSYQTEWDKVFKDFSTVNGMSGTEYADNVKTQITALNTAGWEAAQIQLQIKDTIDTDAAALQALLDASSSTQGALQAAQAGNQIGGVVAQQLMKLQAAMATSNAAQLAYAQALSQNNSDAAAMAQKFFDTPTTATSMESGASW